MEWVWLITFLLMFTPYIVDCPQNQQMNDRPQQVTVDLPQELHVKNYGEYCVKHEEYHGEGSCVHASLRMALNWQNQRQLADDWLKTYGGGGESFETIKEKADPYIKYATGESYDFLVKSLKGRRAPIIGIEVKSGFLFLDFTVGYHCVMVVYADDDYVAIIDPNTSAKPKWMSKSRFMDIWLGWGLTPVYTPAPPTPADYVHEEIHEIQILYVGAEWCGPCKRMKPLVDALAKEYPGRVKVVDEATSELDEKFSVRSYPTMIVFKDGVETSRYSGVIPISVLEDHLK